MFSHVTVGSRDIEISIEFYNAILNPLGLRQRIVKADGGPVSACWVRFQETLPRFYVYIPLDGKVSSVGNGSMVSFLAPSILSVDEAYLAGISKRGICNGQPGLRPQYGDGYYGAYLRDPDGNKIHIVFRGDIVNSEIAYKI